MRVKARKPFLVPYVVSINEFVDLGYEQPREEKLQEEFHNQMFQCIEPGKERTCVILRAEGFGYNEISFIMGITTAEAAKIMYNIRQKLIKSNIGSDLTKQK